MRKCRYAVFIAPVFGCVLADQADASVAFSYVTGASSYSAQPGSTVAVNIYLEETLTDSSSDIISPDGGLIAAGAAINSTLSTGSTAASFSSSSYTVGSPPFTSDSFSSFNIGGGNNVELQELTSPGSYANVNPNDEILLGTLNIKVGTGTTTYSLTSIYNDTISGGSGAENPQGYTATLAGTDLDAGDENSQAVAFTGADEAAPTVFTISAVPEPATLALLSVGGLALLRRRRRRGMSS